MPILWHQKQLCSEMIHRFFLAFYILLAQCLYPSIRAAKAVNGPAFITSPNTCLSNLECQASSYCDYEGYMHSNRCRQRLTLNQTCGDGPPCRLDLYCTRTKSRLRYACLPRIRLGGRCVSGRESCVHDALCTGNPAKCRRRSHTGLKGKPCHITDDCNIAKNLYCSRNRKCVPQEQPGSVCRPLHEQRQCSGFCADVYAKRGGLCMRIQPLATYCNDNEQCGRYEYPHEDSEAPLCNFHEGGVGICALERCLLTKPGIHCDSRADMCDARRSLRCRWEPTVMRNACGQHSRSETNRTRDYCTPGSPFSSCVQDDFPKVCRRSRPGFRRPNGFHVCSRRLETMPHGHVCDHVEYSACEEGSVCAEVPGLQYSSGRLLLPFYRYCVKMREFGQACANKFRFACGRGLHCDGKVCVKDVGQKGSRKTTHISLDGFCSDLQCAPGTVCARGGPGFSSLLRCYLPTKIAGRGDHCFDTARFRKVSPTFYHDSWFPSPPTLSIIIAYSKQPAPMMFLSQKCKAGLICSRDGKGNGYNLCRPQHGIGDHCENNKQCSGNLRCSGPILGSVRFGKCYNKSNALNLGSKCNPKANVNQKQCVSTFVTNLLKREIREMRCLRKEKGFACQVAATLFERCSAISNVACADDNLTCDTKGVCMPNFAKWHGPHVRKPG